MVKSALGFFTYTHNKIGRGGADFWREFFERTFSIGTGCLSRFSICICLLFLYILILSTQEMLYFMDFTVLTPVIKFMNLFPLPYSAVSVETTERYVIATKMPARANSDTLTKIVLFFDSRLLYTLFEASEGYFWALCTLTLSFASVATFRCICIG